MPKKDLLTATVHRSGTSEGMLQTSTARVVTPDATPTTSSALKNGFYTSECAEQVMLRFTTAPSLASDEVVSEARKRRPTYLMNRISSCHVHQLFRGGLLRILFGLCITLGLVGSSLCLFDEDLELLRRWLVTGLCVTWGIGLPHFLAILGSGVKILPHDHRLPEVQVSAAVPTRRITGLLLASVALTVWQCWWWMKGIRLILAARQPSNMAFYFFCLACCILWPVALLCIHRKDAREQGMAMKGAAASILLMPIKRRLSSIVCGTDTESISSGASTLSPLSRTATDSSLSACSGFLSTHIERSHSQDLSVSMTSFEA